MKTDILIIGGGLAGLGLAAQLLAARRDFLLVEARDRFGGRIKTEVLDHGYYDMGPAWYWSGQPRLAALIQRFGLVSFEQHTQGNLAFEDQHGRVEYERGYGAMQGSYRVQGGLHALINALADALPDARKTLGAGVTSLEKTDSGLLATLSDGAQILAQRCVLALPPRVAAAQITFTPALPNATILALQNVATWMAGQAKAVAVYDTPFWRAAGLSGDAMSRYGPMVEIHDACPANGGPAALFGFIGIPASARVDKARLRADLLAQLIRLFGEKAANPRALYVKDWAFDQYTATPLDHAPQNGHPQYGLPNAMQNLWQGRLLFGGTEVAMHFGGYLEGALEAAEHAFREIQNQSED
jgi:monoamine oxidase